MIKSMTGYGRCEIIKDGKKIAVELKSVNHRYSDYAIKLPKYYVFLEDYIRSYVSKYINRGKIDIYVSIESYDSLDKEIILNRQLAESYINALCQLRDTFSLTDDISVATVARYGEIFQPERKEDDREELWKLAKEPLAQAVDMLVSMRESEGGRILSDLLHRVEFMRSLTGEIEKKSPETVKDYEQRLFGKINELLGDRSIDESRILTEVAIFADKVAVNEEIVRLSSHFDEFIFILGKNEPVGRKLDFLIQEMNREVNTIGSKANDIYISKRVVELKAEIEKLREQIQNIE